MLAGRITRNSLSTVLLLAAGACQDTEVLTGPGQDAGTPDPPPRPAAEIVDAAHSLAVENFYFLPPIVANPTTAGTFDASLSPAVEICELDPTPACGDIIANYDMTTGPGSETVRLEAADEHYIVNWHTDDFGLDPSKTYRITILVAGTPLGWADVDVVSSGNQLKNVDTGQFIALKDGKTLPIKFRLEEGAVFVIGSAGGNFSTPDGAVTMDIPAGALSEDVGITVRLDPRSLPDEGLLDGAGYDFGPSGLVFDPPATLTIEYDEADVPTGILEEDLALFKERHGDDLWEEVPSTVDDVANTITGPVDGFSHWRGGWRWYRPIIPRVLPSSLIAPVSATLQVGETLEFTYLLYDRRGSPVLRRFANWYSEDPVVARVVDATAISGVTEGVSAGTTNLKVSGCSVFAVGFISCSTMEAPISVVSPSVATLPASRVSAGAAHTCHVTLAGDIECWGTGLARLGDGVTSVATAPIPIADPPQGPQTWSMVTASGGQGGGGGNFNCALTTGGDVYCWGFDNLGQLGNGASAGASTPVKTADPVEGPQTWTWVSSGAEHTCAVSDTGDVFCWGQNDVGQLGDGSTSNSDEPIKVADPASGPQSYVAVTAAARHSCAIASDGSAFCWGSGGSANRLGNSTVGGGVTLVPVPVTVAGSRTFAALDAGNSHTCGITTDDLVFCWGSGGNGRVGISGVGLMAKSVSTGLAHSCVVKLSGEAVCSGLNTQGQLGNATNIQSGVPVQVVGGHLFESINAGANHTCAIRTDGETLCWGFNSSGQLGDGTMVDRNAPILVGSGAPTVPQLVFVSDRASAQNDIWVANADGSGMAMNITNHGDNDTDPWVSPDGTKIAFVSDRASAQNDIWIMNADGSGAAINISNHGDSDTEPQWSPDGTKVAFKSNRASAQNDIFVANADGSGSAVNVTNHGDNDFTPRWSPDGTKIVFVSDRASAQNDIWVVNSDGSGAAINITNHGDNDWDPRWSPDGMKIAFVSDRASAQNDIWVVNSDGSGAAINITNHGDTDARPRWSPNGTQIAFVSDRATAQNDIWVVNSDGSGAALNITNHGDNDFDPWWSPDGTQIAFVSDRASAQHDIWVANADGSGVAINVTNHGDNDLQPQWKP